MADDLAQETLLKAFRALGADHDPRGNLKAWLFVILRNTWTDRLRKKRDEVSLAEVGFEPRNYTSDVAITSEFGNDPQALMEIFSDQQVIDALKSLPEEIRWTLLLVDVEGVGVQDAAAILEVPSGTIKSRAHRGRAALRQILLPMALERRLIKENMQSPIGEKLHQEEP